MTASSIIKTTNLTKEYDGLVAVDSVSLSINQGEIFGLLGPNGAGKTTTIKMLITLLKPTSGQAEVAGFNVVSQADEIRKRIGYVPQESALDIRLTARENLELFAELYGLPKRNIEPRIKEVLQLVELEKRKDDLVAHFSGGMKRRLEIARGLLPTPQVLFLDEPTLGLDPQTRRIVWDFIHRLQKEWNLTILATTHYLEEADQQMDRVAIIDRGQIMALGKPSDLKNEFGKDLVELTLKAKEGDAGLGEDLMLRAQGLDLGSELTIVDRTLKVAVVDGTKSLPTILHKIESLGVEVESMSVRGPSLDDVFIKYTGRGIREEGGEDSADTKKKLAKIIGKMRQRV